MHELATSSVSFVFIFHSLSRYSFFIFNNWLILRKIVETRQVTLAFEKPEGFSTEARDMWWNLSRDCTQTNPKDRPNIGSIVASLSAIMKAINGKSIYHFLIQVYNPQIGFRCKKHGKLAHKIFISYRFTSDKDILILSSYYFYYLTVLKLCKNVVWCIGSVVTQI